jgi:uncharacterized protein YdeI (YjbR/CyaY-like superfamily)
MQARFPNFSLDNQAALCRNGKSLFPRPLPIVVKFRKPMKSTDLPILPFASKKKWSDWLAKGHDKSTGVWLKIAKKDSQIPSVTYDEALDVALCYGWIDGQKKGYDDKYWLQKFTPRGPKSIWSKINTEKAERLIANAEMKPPGLKVIELAKQDGRWDAAYASQKNVTVPEDFQAELDKNKKALAFFATLNSVNRYAILFRIHNAKKPETRAKRIQQFVEMLERSEKIHP